MSKHKFMIYFLTTTLVLPTFTTSIAHAEDTNEDAKMKSSSTQEEQTDHNEDVNDNNTNEPSQPDDTQSDNTSSEAPTKEDSKNKIKREKSKSSNTSSEEKDDDNTSVSRSHQKRDKDTNNTYRTPLSPIFDATHSSGLPASNFLNPDLYQNGFSLTHLIASLFNFDSDISDYEQPASTNETDDDTHSTNEQDTDSQDQDQTEHSASSSDTTDRDKNDIKQSSEQANQSDKTSQQDETDTNQQSTANQDKDDASVSKALDAIDDFVSDETDDDKDNQGSNNTDDTDHQSNNDDTSTDSNNDSSKTSSSNSNSLSESALDTVLDKYSEDAKKTHQDFESSKKDNASDTSKDEKSKESTNKASNPQLPTKKELEHKTTPAQSFEDDFKQNNTRSTSLFQTLPQLNGSDVTDGDITVVENKGTRDFIKSIAKDAHKIGQDKDLYASVMIAQAILESSSGNSTLAQAPNYNLFGIKGNYKGQSVYFNTLEAGSDNSMFSINAGFRKYPSTKASLEDYADLIKNGIDGNPTIYKPTWKHEAIDYRDATRHLSRTYATDPNYATKLNSLIKHYHLTDFDKKKMPDLDRYAKQTSSGEDASGSEFKSFEITDSSSPYPQGQCTWYVYERVQQFGKKVGSDWGDAHNWDNRAESDNYDVSQTPSTHSAVVFEAGQAGAHDIYGHVAFVEKVNKDGSIVISEANVKGLGIVSYRTIDASTAEDLHYIEPK